MLPEEVGGGGIGDVLTGCVVQEELNWGCAGDRQPDHLGRLLRPAAARGGDAGAARALAAAFVRGAAAADGARLDRARRRLRRCRDDHRRRRTGSGYRLNGQKTWISNGGLAEFYVIFATVAPGTGSRGVTAFVVEKGDAGVSFGEPMRKHGQRAIVSTEVFLHDVDLPADRLLGEEGKGFYSLMHTFDESRVHLAAGAIGIARAALEYATEYARERTAFGKPIGQHQAVGFRLADMATRIDAARLLTHRAARSMDAGRHVPAEAAMAKLFASEAATWCTWAAVQTLGGWGYSREYPVEKWMRDAKLEEIEEGTSDIQRLIIARSLLGR